MLTSSLRISKPVKVSLLSDSPSNRSGEMTAKRRSWPDMSAQKAFTQSARFVEALDLGVDLGVVITSGVCRGDGVLGCCPVSGIWEAMGLVVDSEVESSTMICGGGNVP